MTSTLSSHPGHVHLIRKLRAIGELPRAEEQALLDFPAHFTQLRARHDIVADEARPSRCALLLDGFVCRYKMLADGSRQILSFHIAGDMPDLVSLHLKRMDHSIATVAATEVAVVEHAALHDLLRTHPIIADLFWRDTLIDAAIYREWMVGIGRRDALGRVAHMICEMYVKNEAVGLTTNHDFVFPLTQREIADALGLSIVHVNRVLQKLRQDGVISFKANRHMVIHDWKELAAIGEFDPAYLHMNIELT